MGNELFFLDYGLFCLEGLVLEFHFLGQFHVLFFLELGLHSRLDRFLPFLRLHHPIAGKVGFGNFLQVGDQGLGILLVLPRELGRLGPGLHHAFRLGRLRPRAHRLLPVKTLNVGLLMRPLRQFLLLQSNAGLFWHFVSPFFGRFRSLLEALLQ